MAGREEVRLLKARGKRARLRLLSVFLLLPMLASCFGGKAPETSEVLSAMTSAQSSLPAGNYYTTKSSPGAPDYLSDSVFAALYGSGESPAVMKRTESVSAYISSGLYAFEMAVFLCVSERDTAEIADLCLSRIELMRTFYNTNARRLSLDMSAKENIDNAKVSIIGRYVIMAVCGDAKRAVEAAKDLIS